MRPADQSTAEAAAATPVNVGLVGGARLPHTDSALHHKPANWLSKLNHLPPSYALHAISITLARQGAVSCFAPCIRCLAVIG